MKLDDFIKEKQGKQWGYPDQKHYLGQCLSIVKLYIKECFEINPPPSGSDSAFGYWANFPTPLDTVFKKTSYSAPAIPKRGDIVIWAPTTTNKYGHISIALEGSAGSFRSFDQNWNGREAHIQNHLYKNVIGWLTPKEIDIMSPTVEITDQTKIPQIENKEVQAIRSELNDLRRDVKNLKEENKEIVDSVKEIGETLHPLGFIKVSEMGEAYTKQKETLEQPLVRLAVGIQAWFDKRTSHDS